MALDLTTTKQDGIAYDSAVELTIAAGTTSSLPPSMKAFKIHPTSNTDLDLNFPNGTLSLSIDSSDDDGKIIPFRPESIAVDSELTIEMLF